MKKLFYLLIGILLIPTVAKAYTSGHSYGEGWVSDLITIKYKAMYTNKEGEIPYGTIFEIEDETNETICNDDDICAKIEDLTAVLDEYAVDNKLLGKEESILVVTNTEIKSGPGIAYKTIGSINKDSTIKARHIDNIIEVKDCEDSMCYAENPWYYVEYNGIKGYISVYRTIYRHYTDNYIVHKGNDIVFNIKNKELMAFEDIEIMSFDTNEVIKTIKVGTKFTAKLGAMWDDKYIEYDGVKGYIKGHQYIGYKGKITLKSSEELDVYDTFGKDRKKIATIKPGTTLESDYYMSEFSPVCYYMYYENGNIKGFVQVQPVDENDFPKIIESVTSDNKTEDVIVTEEVKEIIAQKKDYTLYICIGSGIVISITAIITIILINNKKSKKL